MLLMRRVISLSLPVFALMACAHQASTDRSADAVGHGPVRLAEQALPPGVTELQFGDFFKLPVGPRGLEPTEKLLSLKDKQVRVVGYMVQAEEPTPGLFMLSPVPVNIPEKEDGASDDLPGSTLFVHMPAADADKILAYRPGLWALVGTLKLGGQEESNGRVSYVRLLLDPSAAAGAPMPLEKPEPRADAN
jgi:hypothetical protein